MNKRKIVSKNLNSIIKSINKSIIISFFIILFFSISIVGVAVVRYKNKEDEIAAREISATFSAFVSELSKQLIAVTTLVNFEEYIHSGPISRKNMYSLMIATLYNAGLLDLNMIVGMEIHDNDYGGNIFNYGEKTESSIILDLCYLNRRFLDFDVGTCSYKWILYFNLDAIVKELKRINPKLIDCSGCGRSVVFGERFGGFPMSGFSNMEVNLTVEKKSLTSLWKIIFFIVSSLVFLIIWNINRIKSIFRSYLTDPIIEITSKIKENKPLPSSIVEELSYLTAQIDQWKSQVVELETVKAKEEAREARVKTMQSIGASIAHELRTPLRSIISGVSGIEKFLPTLLNGYDLAREADLLVEIVRPQQIKLLRKVLTNLKIEGRAINTIIDMLLMKIRETISEAASFQRLSIKDCVSEALQRYAFQESERDLVVYNVSNCFQFNGDKILIVHVLFNLFKNALYYISDSQKGKIYIHFERGENENRLNFMDTGKGISDDVLPYIFDRFYSKTEGGVGIGLSFCKMAMEWIGGDITCQSVEGKYTEFTLHFPIFKE